MFPLRDHLPDGLHHLLQLLHRPNDSAVNKLEFWIDSRAELLESGLVAVDVVEGMCAVRVFGEEVIFGSDGFEDGGKVLGEVRAIREER